MARDRERAGEAPRGGYEWGEVHGLFIPVGTAEPDTHGYIQRVDPVTGAVEAQRHDLRDELQAHLEMETAEHVRRGKSFLGQ